MNFDAEVLVAGGGLAGGAAACLLARAGRQVLLIDREAGPHDKICGEFLSSEAVADLRELGVDPQALGAEPIDRVRLVRGGHVVETALPFSGFGLSRRTLDEALLERAEACGARVLRGHRVQVAKVPAGGQPGIALAPAGGPAGPSLAATGGQAGPALPMATGLAAGVDIEVGCGIGCPPGEPSGADPAFCLHVEGVGELRAPALFLATGKHDLRGLRRAAEAPPLVGFKMYFELAAEQQHALAGAVEMLMFDHGYAGLQRVDGGRANLCWLSDRAQLQRCGGDWEQLLASMLAESVHLRRRLAGARQLLQRPLAISQVPYGFIHRPATGDPPQLWRLGDQAAVIPSFTGCGMSIALHSAWLAADAYLAGEGASQYHRQLAADVSGPIWRAGMFYRWGRSAVGRHVLMALATAWPPVLRHAASWTRIARGSAVSRPR